METPAPGSRPLQILVVDDDSSSRDLARALLLRAPQPALRAARLVDASSVADATSVLADQFDLILLDMHLPDGDGLMIAREQTRRDPRPVIIALTGDPRPEQRAAALEAGCDAYLEKSSTFGAFWETLAAHVPALHPTEGS